MKDGVIMAKRRIAIIGGGASGMMAAIVAAGKGAEVCIYEKNDRIGKKILATGNGKCNFSNLHMDDDCYRGHNIVKVMDILSRFTPRDCISFFEDRGMLVKNRDGYLYPASEQASTVLDILRMQLAYMKVEVVTDCEIYDIKQEECNGHASYTLNGSYMGTKKKYIADRVIFACGSLAGIPSKFQKGKNAYDILNRMKLPMVAHVPALVQLRCKEDFMKAVAGVRVDGEVTLYIDGEEICSERGEVQLTDYGVSGIPVFQLSRYASYALHEQKRVQVKLNVLPAFSEEQFDKFCLSRTVQSPDQTAEEFFIGICNKKLLMLFMKLAGIKPTDRICNISNERKTKMFDYMRELVLEVVATNPFEQAQVCAGGLDMDAVDDNLQIKSYPGVYVVGELLDVDGRCGGYNLQWAFASGYIAGCNAAEG